jgi:hypothetical protein
MGLGNRSAVKPHLTLTISSLLTLVLTTLHFTQDVLHTGDGVDAQGVAIMLGILLVYLFGIVELAGKRPGYVVMLLGGLAAAYMPFLHGMGPRATRWGFLFIWTMFAMGVSGTFAAFLAARELWRSRAASST